MSSPTLQELEALERTGNLASPVLRKRLAELRKEAEVEREYAAARSAAEAKASLADKPQARPLPSSPGEIRGECVGLLCLNLSNHRIPDGYREQFVWGDTICFAPADFLDWLRGEGEKYGITWIREALTRYGRGGEVLAPFEPNELEGNLFALVKRLVHEKHRNKTTYLEQVWTRIVNETRDEQRLRAWYLAAARDGSHEQMKRLRSRLIERNFATTMDPLWGEGDRAATRAREAAYRRSRGVPDSPEDDGPAAA